MKEKFSAVSIVVNGFYHVHSIVHPENMFVSSIKSDTKWVRKIGRYYGDTICAMYSWFLDFRRVPPVSPKHQSVE